MKNKRVDIIFMLFCVLLSVTVYTQQDAQYTQYMYNTISVNPAYAGTRDVLSISALHRSQWVGLEGAPKTQTLSLHSPINKSKKLGLGLSVVNDKIGPTSETYFDIDISYSIFFEEGRFSFGLKGGGNLLNVDFSKLNPYNPEDQELQNNINNKFSPNVGVGFYYSYLNKWYIGLSVPDLLETKYFESSSVSTGKERMSFYAIGGYVFDLNYNIKFKPAVLTKLTSGAPLQVDLSANFLISEKVTLGAAYRWSAAFSAMTGIQVSDNLMLGFAYDTEVTDLGNTRFNKGSYEVFLRYEFLDKLYKILSPRFF